MVLKRPQNQAVKLHFHYNAPELEHCHLAGDIPNLLKTKPQDLVAAVGLEPTTYGL
jgi:hypothetical protein